MKRTCQECNQASINLRLLTFTNTMDCTNCFYQFEYTWATRLFLYFLRGFIPIAATYIGLEYGSWIIFGILILSEPFIIELAFAKYSTLKPVGLRSKLRAKGL